MRKLLISTGNKDKIIEIRAEYQDLEYEIISPDQLGLNLDVEETGSTLEENALLKARAGAEASNLLTLADDTGLEVDALDGRPGIYSARFAGKEATYQDNNQKLLKMLEDYPEAERTACFVTVAALVDPATGSEETVRG
ncbi:MAG: non-canonical purine NTP pyrophosphatase, partial [Halarsenatibacteraceae bacterium]